MLFKFKRDYTITLDGLDDRIVDNSFTFKKGNYYYGYLKKDMDFDNVVIEDRDEDVKIELDRKQIEEYIDW